MEDHLQAWTHQLGSYMSNCFVGPRSEKLFRCLEEHAEILASRMSGDGDEDGIEGDYDAGGSRTEPRSRQPMAHRRAELSRFLATFRENPPLSPGEDNVRFASEEFELSPIDVEIVLLAGRYGNYSLLEDFADSVFGELDTHGAAVAALVGCDPDEVDSRFAVDAPLMRSGILSIDLAGNGLFGPDGVLKLTGNVLRSLRVPFATRLEWVNSLVGRSLASELSWEDYAHLGAPADLARRALAGWRSAPEPGLNVMLVGPPGTGKTEFAMVLAAAAGMRLWSIGETGTMVAEPSRAERLASLRLAGSIMQAKTDGALLLDEGEDVLAAARTYGSQKRNLSKLFLNRALDTNPVPVIWTCNELSDMDPATIRRMTQVVEVKVPDRRARTTIWRKVLSRERLELDADAADRLARRWSAAPAVASNAARLARLAGGGEIDIETALSGSMRALGLGVNPPDRDGGDFDPALTVCSEDLAAMARNVGAPGASRRWSACIHGASGTGKSQFARHLADRMGLEVHLVRASTVKSKYVGDTEKKIADAFTDARARGAMLIFDEAEALIFNREEATHSWEVSHVDEMLTWMEDHPLPFVATTNAMAQVDAAALRRFTFKLKFETLTPEATAKAFNRFFGQDAPPGLPDGLAPGDFANVRDRAAVLGTRDSATLSRWLAEEAEAKGARRVGPVGFRAPVTRLAGGTAARN